MARLRPDPSFYASPSLAAEAPPEDLAYVALLAAGGNGQPRRPRRRRHESRQPDLWPPGGPHGLPAWGERAPPFRLECVQLPPLPLGAERPRRASLPGRSRDSLQSRIHILDTKPDPRRPALVKMIEGTEVMAKTGYAAPHTVHCGPDGIYLNALGAPDGNGPGGIFMLDHETFELKGRWEQRPGPAIPRVRLRLASGTGHHAHQRVGHAQHGGGGRESRAAAGRQVRSEAARVGPAEAHPSQGARPRRRAADGARASSRAQPDPRLRLRRRRDLADGSVELDLPLVSRPLRRQREGRVEDEEGHHDPRRAGRRGRSAAVAQRLQGRPTARDRHQPVGRRPLPVCVVLGNR